MVWQASFRSLVEELDVSNLVDVLSDKYSRFSDAWEGLKWLLSRNPTPKGSVRRTVGDREYRVYVLGGDEIAGTPDLWVVYTHTDTEVTILGVTTADPVKDEEPSPSAQLGGDAIAAE